MQNFLKIFEAKSRDDISVSNTIILQEKLLNALLCIHNVNTKIKLFDFIRIYYFSSQF
jgi:hypothetical protein